jgi:hypothetical protein
VTSARSSQQWHPGSGQAGDPLLLQLADLADRRGVYDEFRRT